MLRKLHLKGVYKSDQDDILRDFYFPTLLVATRYDRAVGFFSASTLHHAAQALSAFVGGGGHIRLIVGAFTDQTDIDAAKEGLRLRELSESLGAQFVAELDAAADDALFRERFRALAWLIAKGRLEIRVALRPKGLYHDKVGVITDASGDSIVFSGSANESASALLPTRNYESIDVFPTWREELADWHRPHKESFERLWHNKSRGTAVIDLPTALRDRFLETASTMEGPPDPERELEIAGLVRAAEEAAERSSRRLGPRVAAYYGQIIYRYTLRQAIEDKVLTPYNYHPHIIELTHDEAQEFVELSTEIARMFAREGGRAASPSQALTGLRRC